MSSVARLRLGEIGERVFATLGIVFLFLCRKERRYCARHCPLVMCEGVYPALGIIYWYSAQEARQSEGKANSIENALLYSNEGSREVEEDYLRYCCGHFDPLLRAAPAKRTTR